VDILAGETTQKHTSRFPEAAICISKTDDIGSMIITAEAFYQAGGSQAWDWKRWYTKVRRKTQDVDV